MVTNNYSKMRTPKPKTTASQPKMEELQPLTDYAITISPSDLLLTTTLRGSVIKVKKYFNKIFQDDDINIILFPELSPSGRLHYHGTIRFLDHATIFQWYFSTKEILFEKEINFLIKPITEPDEWNKYIIKQRKWVENTFIARGLHYIYHNQNIIKRSPTPPNFYIIDTKTDTSDSESAPLPDL